MERGYNFALSPAMLPLEVLKKAQSNFLLYGNSGASILELPYDSPDFQIIVEDVKNALRELLELSQDQVILFLPGNFKNYHAAIPMNFMNEHNKADYVLSSLESKEAYLEAFKYGDVSVVASSAGAAFSMIPEIDLSKIRPDIDYLFLEYNNPNVGTAFRELPEIEDIPLIVDLSTVVGRMPINYSGIDAGFISCDSAFGISGLTIAFIKESLLNQPMPRIPEALNFTKRTYYEEGCSHPQDFSIYLLKLVLDWYIQRGGFTSTIQQIEKQSKALYEFLDESHEYYVPTNQASRSPSCILFSVQTGEEQIEPLLRSAQRAGILNLQYVEESQAIRIVLTPALEEEGLDHLIRFLKSIQEEH